MKIHVSPTEVFITYEQRSVNAYYPVLSQYVSSLFEDGIYTEEAKVTNILEGYYDWCAKEFQLIISDNDDMLFVNYIFAYHESSVQLWMRTLRKEDLQEKYGFSEDDLSMNRRIFKLALEQACDMNLTKSSKATHGLIRHLDQVIEDLLYIGTELYHAAQFLSEMRMIPGSLEATIQKDGAFQIRRRFQIESVFDALFLKLKEDFGKGIMDTDGVTELKAEIQHCFGIDYDFAAHQIIYIKKQLSPQNWQFQTIEPGVLVQNLVANGVSQVNAENFYAGLTLTSGNKLPIKDAVYKVNSMERYFFRPILEITQNGNKRHLIGREKWAESITVLATNNFQWNKAPDEWKQNNCFQQYLERKSSEHDALLEDEVETNLKQNNIPCFRNITSFGDGKTTKTINIAGVGEIDFIWLDLKRKRIVVADCKYNRARYDMISFSTDYSNFKDIYEKKIKGKSKWVEENKSLVYGHFKRLYPKLDIDIAEYNIEELFVINTPTFYMYLGRVNTTCFFNLEEFMENNYTHPDLIVYQKEGFKTKIRIKPYPYL